MSSSRTKGSDAEQAQTANGGVSSQGDGGGSVVDVTMPQMGVSVAEGTVVAWRVEVGDQIEADQTICEISTDKIDTEVPAPVGGVVSEILVPVDTTVGVGEILARIATGSPAAGGDGQAGPDGGVADQPAVDVAGDQLADAGADEPRAADDQVAADGHGADGDQGAGGGAQAPPPARASAPPGAEGDGHEERRRYSPVVLRIASEHGIDLAQIPGTGRGGRVRKQDVLAFIESGGAGAERPEPGAAAVVEEPPLHIESPYRPEPVAPRRPTPPPPGPPPRSPEPVTALQTPGHLSRMRRQIGEHMKRSLDTTATCTTWIEADMSRIESARKNLRMTALPFVARATIAALREHPTLNAWLQGEDYTVHQAVHLGIAVSLGDDGLIVPVVHDAHELSVEGLAARIKDLARRARQGGLTPDEVRGGTFTITNPGQFGSIMATPIINLPQVAILDLEAVIKRPVVVTDADGNDSIAIRPMTILGLSWDHRALDGAVAAQFLATLKRHIEGWSGA